jgi:acyl-CoA thioester hydrolase
MHKKFDLPIQSRFCDLDGAGHINNSIYHQYIELARTHFCDQVLGYKVHTENGKLPIVLARIEMDFVQQTFINDNIVVRTWIGKIGEKSFQQISELHSQRGLLAKSKSVLVWFDYTTNFTMRVPDLIRSKLEQYLENSAEV